MRHLKSAGKNLIVLLFWLVVWELLALQVSQQLLLPAPDQVVRRVLELAATARFWRITAFSLLRILCGVLVAIVSGTVLAAVTSRFKLLHALLSPVLTTIKSTPVASFIILALVWMGRDILPSFIAVLMVLPVVWTNLSAGIASADKQLLELAKVFRFSKWKTCLRIYVPSAMPYFVSACRTSLGLGWKAGIAAEVLTVPANSIGKMLYESKLYLETVDLFAWTLVIILCSLIIEKVLMAAIGRLGKKYRTGVTP
jgi:NitT/TauT family transport system permease protein